MGGSSYQDEETDGDYGYLDPVSSVYCLLDNNPND